MQAWERSKLDDTDKAAWQTKNAAYKKAREELQKTGGERTIAEKKADLQAQLAALE